MTEDKRKRGRAAVEEIDLRLDGLLGKLGTTLGEMLEGLERGEGGEIRRTHDFTTTRGPVRAETGIRVRVGLGEGDRGPRPWRPAAGAGTPAPDPAPPAPAEPPQEERPIAMEAYAADGRWVLGADLPGATLPDVQIALEDGALTIATTGARRYVGRHPLPPGTDPADMTWTMRNGVLEISVALAPEGEA